MFISRFATSQCARDSRVVLRDQGGKGWISVRISLDNSMTRRRLICLTVLAPSPATGRTECRFNILHLISSCRLLAMKLGKRTSRGIDKLAPVLSAVGPPANSSTDTNAPRFEESSGGGGQLTRYVRFISCRAKPPTNCNFAE